MVVEENSGSVVVVEENNGNVVVVVVEVMEKNDGNVVVVGEEENNGNDAKHATIFSVYILLLRSSHELVLFCLRKINSRKDSMQRHVMSKHRNAGLIPFQTVPMSSRKCQRSRFEHPFTFMIAGMTGSGKTASVRSLLQQASGTIYIPRGEDCLVLLTMAACVYRNVSRHATH